jgi:hypothetical protein
LNRGERYVKLYRKIVIVRETIVASETAKSYPSVSRDVHWQHKAGGSIPQ